MPRAATICSQKSKGTVKEQLQDALWWDYDGNTISDPIDPFLLHARGYDGTTGSGGSVRVVVEVVAGCDP